MNSTRSEPHGRATALDHLRIMLAEKVMARKRISDGIRSKATQEAG